jgi:two-component system sensor histidine kinase UhpB
MIRTHDMWKSFSLQSRLSVLFCTVLLAVFAVVLAGLLAFSAVHLENERQPPVRVAAQITEAINAELSRADPARREAIAGLLWRLNEQPDSLLRYREAPTAQLIPPPAWFSIPDWFGKLVGAETQPQVFAIDAAAGELVLFPSDSADVYEKWIAFLLVAAAPFVLGLLAFGMTQMTVRATLHPLRELAAAISRLKTGDYRQSVVAQGPPEIRRACEEINELADMLTSLRESNNGFVKRIVSAQDDEREEIGRDLHDEFSPLLFAARANALALQSHGSTNPELAAQAAEISRIVESIQRTNGRLLARLRPLDLENLGLVRNIAALIDSPAARAGNLLTEIRLDPEIDRLDELSARMVYRFVQESITNILRHARASKAAILATMSGSMLTAEVSDNGVGMPQGTQLGRGLEGMKERISALGGTFLITSNSAGTVIRCTLPLG